MRARAISLSVFALMVATVASGQNLAEVAHMKHEGGVHALAFSADGRYLATGGYDRSTRVWEVPSGREIIRLTPFIVGQDILGMLTRGTTTAVAFSPNGRYLATGNIDGTRVWEVASGGQIHFVGFRIGLAFR